MYENAFKHRRLSEDSALCGAGRRGTEHRFQSGFCLAPLTVQDAEVDRITYPARPGDQVLVQRSFFFRANPQDSIARLLV